MLEVNEREITRMEMQEATRELKEGRAAGMDGRELECLKGGRQVSLNG